MEARCPPHSVPPRRALASGQHRLPRAGLRLLAPIDDPEKVICVGLNYRDHCLEQDVKVPKEPLIFSKFPSAIAGPFDDIVHPAESSVSARGPSPPAGYGPAQPPCTPPSPPGGGLGGGVGCHHREDGAAHPGNTFSGCAGIQPCCVPPSCWLSGSLCLPPAHRNQRLWSTLQASLWPTMSVPGTGRCEGMGGSGCWGRLLTPSVP